MRPSPPPSLRRAVLAWYSGAKRDLPWRRTRDPYAVWVSEIMLQQTRVETVVPFYERFLRRFPDVESLARAREPAVLAAWSGLGYYRRARHLHAAARMVAREHGGRIPGDRVSLEELPGIGGYTASAIASIAFGAPGAAVDGNVIRVIARIAGFRGRRDSAALRLQVGAWAESLTLGPSPGDWTQAVMELGALVCLPRDPLCTRCPAARLCVARKSGDPGRYPEASTPKAPRAERRLLLLASAGDRVLLVPDNADAKASWTLPYAVLGTSTSPRSAARALAARHLRRAAEPSGPSTTFQHRTFSHNMTYEVWCLKLPRGAKPDPERVWATRRQLRGLPLRSPTLKALKSLDP